MRYLDLCTPVYSTAAMREADRATMEDFGLPGFTLMETAARGAARAIVERYGALEEKHVLVLAGKGNNGGDGLAIARILLAEGANVRVATLANDDNATPDTLHNLRLLNAIEASFHGDLKVLSLDAYLRQDGSGAEGFDIDAFETEVGADYFVPELIVDALLGIGVEGPLREPVRTIAAWADGEDADLVAIDIPTGVNSDTGEADQDAIRADLTVTMARPKVGLLFGPGRHHAGEVVTVDIGIPTHVEIHAMEAGSAYLPTDASVRAALPRRPFDAHKYEAGMALVVAGSNGYTGAAVLASQAAARIGAGYVVCATTPDAQRALDAQAPPVATVALPTTGSGGLAKSAPGAILDRADKARAVLIGPGLGRDAETVRLVHRLLDALADDFPHTPVVLDADGLNALAEADETVWQIAHRYDEPRWVLTPHLGEFRRLVAGSGGDPDALDLHRRTWIVPKWAQRWHAVLLLKGAPSVVGQPGSHRPGDTFVATSVNPALATAGSGDVLAGSIAGLIAQGCLPAEAATAALHIGAAAAERYTSTRAGRAMQATDLIEALPYVLSERFG